MVASLMLKFVTETCCNCGIVFAITEERHERLVETKENFYCPNGHSQHYLGQSKDAQIEELKLSVQMRENQLSEERRKREKLEKRIKKGVCLYCKRFFKNLADHIECKHPDKK